MILRIVLLCLSFFISRICYGQGVYGYQELVEDVPGKGALCAIKKAYQLTDIIFTPFDSIIANPVKKYEKGKEYSGLIYSSVKEIDTFVGIDVSLHTFMTALHNPRSDIYTKNISKHPFHGVNCGAYYGVVCNTFVSYALGFKVSKSTFDFSQADNMILVENQSSNGVRLADVVYEKGHVMLVTRIIRDVSSGMAVELEISEAKHSGCRRYMMSGKELDDNILAGKWFLYRYKYLEENTYEPMNYFVAVDNETLIPFKYNDDICTNRGDKACFILGDTVTLNITKEYETVEIYKDSAFYQKVKIGKRSDIQLINLPFGDYRARVICEKGKSDFTYWKVIDVSVIADAKEGKVVFHSYNSTPVYLEFCSISGVRPTDGVFELSSENIKSGIVDVSNYKMSDSQKKKGMYIKVHFECDYGRVINKPIKWE